MLRLSRRSAPGRRRRRTHLSAAAVARRRSLSIRAARGRRCDGIDPCRLQVHGGYDGAGCWWMMLRGSSALSPFVPAREREGDGWMLRQLRGSSLYWRGSTITGMCCFLIGCLHVLVGQCLVALRDAKFKISKLSCAASIKY